MNPDHVTAALLGALFALGCVVTYLLRDRRRRRAEAMNRAWRRAQKERDE